MFKVIPTNYYQNSDEFKKCYRNYGTNKVEYIRINCTRVSLKQYEDEIVNLRKDFRNINGYDIKILLDLPLPKTKPRLEFKLPIQESRIAKSNGEDHDYYLVKKDEIVKIHCDSKISELEFKVSEQYFIECTKVGEIVTVGENSLKLLVINKTDNFLELNALDNGYIPYKKYVYSESCNCVTNHDIDGYKELISSVNPEMIALSFIENGEEVLNFKKSFGINEQIKIMSKIESEKAFSNLNSIINNSDMIMIARGDLFFNVDILNFPFYIDSLIQQINGKIPFYVATGVLEDIREINLSPSRSSLIDLYYFLKMDAEGVILTFDSSLDISVFNECNRIIKNMRILR